MRGHAALSAQARKETASHAHFRSPPRIARTSVKRHGAEPRVAGRAGVGMEVQESGCGAAESEAPEPSAVPSKTAGGAGHYELPW